MRGGAAASALGIALVLGAARADAQSPLDDARASYEAGAAAYDRKDYAVAAARFRDADDKVPNARTLKLALASALLASDPALAMALVERAEGRPSDSSTTELVRRVRARFAHEAARATFACPPRFECRAYVDGREVDVSRHTWLAPAKHSFVVSAKGAAVYERELDVAARELVEIAPTERDLTLPPPAPPPASAAETTPAVVSRSDTPSPDARSGGDGLSPIWFGGTVIATTLAAGAGVYFTVVAKERHDAFVADPSAEKAAEGDAAQSQARIAFAVAGGLAVTSIVLALFTDFRGDRRPPPVTVGIHDRGAALGGRF